MKASIFTVNSAINFKAEQNLNMQWFKTAYSLGKKDTRTFTDFYLSMCFAVMSQKSGFNRIPV